MMVDALEAIIEYLRADADLNLLTAGRIAAKHKFGASAEAWPIPGKALQMRVDGGVPELDIEWQRPRLEARCYGESQYEAGRVYRQLVSRARLTNKARVQTGDGYALLYWLLPTSGGSLLTDPDTGQDLVLFFLEAAVSEIDIP